MILKTDKAATRHINPGRIQTRKFADRDQSTPLRTAKLNLQNHFAILMMLDAAILYDNLDLIPLANCFHILGARGNQIIQGACGTVSINAHFGIGMSVIVQYLHLWCRFVNHIELRLLRAPVKNTGIPSFGDSPFKLKVKISELLGKQ